MAQAYGGAHPGEPDTNASSASDAAAIHVAQPDDSLVLHVSGSRRVSQDMLQLRSIFSSPKTASTAGTEPWASSTRAPPGLPKDPSTSSNPPLPIVPESTTAASDVPVAPSAPQDGSSGPSAPKYPKAFSKTTFDTMAGSFERHAVAQHDHKPAGWKHTLLLAYGTIGTIYGDLGTSPLYTVGSVFGRIEGTPGELDLLGTASCIFWTVTLIPLIKYVFIVLYADDLGEGGTFALYSKLCRYASISLIGSRVDPEVKDQLAHDYSDAAVKQRSLSRRADVVTNTSNRTLDEIPENKPMVKEAEEKPEQNASEPVGKSTFFRKLLRGGRRPVVAILEKYWTMRQLMLVLTLLGTCGVLADGVLTPSISVLSAVGGLTAANVPLTQSEIAGISCGILVALFAIQRFGTGKISVAFSPVILIWLLVIASIGIYNIATFMPSVFKAISPWYAINFFTRNGFNSWVALGDIALCITGAEALFADMGHFSRTSIQLAFAFVLYPCVILAYFGQVAYLTRFPEDSQNAFFASIPKPVFWPVFVIAILSAIVASQALITGAFSIIKQSMTLSCFPKAPIIHTSDHHEGQIYIPSVNWTLLVLTVAVTAGFQSSTAIGNAFGVTVLMVMLLTTTLVSVVMLVSWDLSFLVVFPFWLFYTTLEGVIFSSTLYKVPQGGWFPLALSVILLFIMYTWHFGTYKKRHYATLHKKDESALLSLLREASLVDGVAIAYTDLDEGTPPVLLHYMSNMPVINKVVISLTVKQLPVPRLDEEHRMFVASMSYKGSPINGFYRAMVFYGYNENWNHGPDFIEQLHTHVISCASEGDQIGHAKSLYRTLSAWEASLSKRHSSTYQQQPASIDIPTATLQDNAEGDAFERADSAEDAKRAEAARADQVSVELGHTLSESGASFGGRTLSGRMSEVELEDAWDFNQVFFMGRTTAIAEDKAKFVTKILIPMYTALRVLGTSPAILYQVPTDRLLEVGMVYKLK